MSKLSTKPISASITDGYVHIILPDLGEPTGWKSYRIKLDDFTSTGVNPYEFAFSENIDLSEINGVSEGTLTGATEFTPIQNTAKHGFSHLVKLFLNGITPTFKNFIQLSSDYDFKLDDGYINLILFQKLGDLYYYIIMPPYYTYPEALNVTLAGTVAIGDTLSGTYDYYDNIDLEDTTNSGTQYEFKGYSSAENAEDDLDNSSGTSLDSGRTLGVSIDYLIDSADEDLFIVFWVKPYSLTGDSPGNWFKSNVSEQVYDSSYSNTKSLSITTSGNEVTITSHADFDLNNSTTDKAIIVSAWVKLLGNTEHTVLQRSANNNAALSFYCRINSSRKLVFCIMDTANKIIAVFNSANSALSLNTWYHVIYAYDGSCAKTGIKMYVDGTLQTNSDLVVEAYGVNKSNTYALKVGLYYNGTTVSNMLIDNLAVYKDVAIDNTIATELYNSGLPIAHNLSSISSDLVTWIDFNDDLIDVISSHNGSAGTPVYSTDIKT